MKYARLLQILLKIWPQDNVVELLYNYPIRFPRYFPFQQNIHATSCEVNNNQYCLISRTHLVSSQMYVSIN